MAVSLVYNNKQPVLGSSTLQVIARIRPTATDYFFSIARSLTVTVAFSFSRDVTTAIKRYFIK